MKILVSGGCGFVGTNLILELSKNKKNKIINIDNLYRKGTKENLKVTKKLDNVYFHKQDITNKKIIKKFKNISIIIMCASEPSILAGVDGGIKNLMATNFLGTLNLLEMAKLNNSKIIFLSTNRVYSVDELNKVRYVKGPSRFEIKDKQKIEGISKKGISESFSTDGLISYYGLSKLFSERLIIEFCQNNKLKYIINRFGIIAGKYQLGKQDQGIISYWIKMHIKKRKLYYFGYGGKGNQVRDILNINDLCLLLKKQIRGFSKINNKIFNVGGGKSNSISLQELSNMCSEITGNNLKIYPVTKNRIYDIPYYTTDNTNIIKTYNWKPKISPRETIRQTFEWLKKAKKF